VGFVIRVEDIESGLQWILSKRYSDFFHLYEDLNDMTTFLQEVPFPKKKVFQYR